MLDISHAVVAVLAGIGTEAVRDLVYPRIRRAWQTRRSAAMSRCAFISKDNNRRCVDVVCAGGFCAAHDALIYELGGDNSPGGQAIIRRSALTQRST